MATKAPSKSSKLTPLNDHVIVERVEAQSTTKGGIVLPDTAKEKPKEGIVIAVGEGRLTEDGQRIAVQVKPKDRIIFSSYAGTEVKWQGEDLRILRENEVLAVIS